VRYVYFNLPIRDIIVKIHRTKVKETEYRAAVQVLWNVAVTLPASSFIVLKL
jgi:hypothetical protein